MSDESKRKCAVCGSDDDGLRIFAITVDQVALNMQPVLCRRHGNEYLVRAGALLGQMMTGK